MKFRTHVLAGLVAAAALPSFANAAPHVDIGELQRRAQIGHSTETVTRESRPDTTDRRQAERTPAYVDLGVVQQRAQVGTPHRDGQGGRSAEFFAEHQRAMNEGVSHIEASELAARKLAKTH